MKTGIRSTAMAALPTGRTSASIPGSTPRKCARTFLASSFPLPADFSTWAAVHVTLQRRSQPYSSGTRDEVYVQAFAGASGKWPISVCGGIEPVCGRNGSELFYRNGDEMMAVDVETRTAFEAGAPRALFEGQYARVAWGEANYDISPDGQRFLMIKGVALPPSTELHLVLNWFEELPPPRR